MGEAWKAIDVDKSNTITEDEIFSFAFKYMDSNGDGIWNLTEIIDFVQDYAHLLHRNMSEGWKEDLKKGYDAINYGVSARELELALSRSGKDISNFKDFIMDISKPIVKKKGRIDMFEL